MQGEEHCRTISSDGVLSVIFFPASLFIHSVCWACELSLEELEVMRPGTTRGMMAKGFVLSVSLFRSDNLARFTVGPWRIG